MPSVPSLDRQKASKVFQSVVQSHIQDALPAAEDRLRAVLGEGETLPDIAFLVTLMGRVENDGAQRLIVADDSHVDELVNDTGPRALRDALAQKVYRKMVEIRRITDGLFGPVRGAQVLAADGGTALVTQPENLWRQARHTLSRLESPGFALPAMTTSSLQFDPAQLAAELRSDTDALREALDAVELERRKAEATLTAKTGLIAETGRIESACARIFEGIFLLADRVDLLEKFRRALRRLSRRGASSTDDESPVPEVPEPRDEEPQDEEPRDEEPQDGESSENASSEG